MVELHSRAVGERCGPEKTDWNHLKERGGHGKAAVKPW